MHIKGLLGLSVAILFVSLALTYQNCGQAGFDQAKFASEEDSGRGDSSLRQVPFPFVMRPNHILYSSCPITNNAVLPSFQIAAFDDQNVAQYPFPAPGLSRGGLGLRSEFINYVKNLGTQDPAVRDRRLAEHISQHPDVVGTRAVISFRMPGDFNNTNLNIINSLGKAGTGIEKIMPFVFSNLDHPAISSEYVIRRSSIESEPDSRRSSELSYRNFFPGINRRSQQGMMASIFLGSPDNQNLNPITGLINNMILTMGFAWEDESNKIPNEIGYYPVGAGSRGEKMQGIGLQMQLSVPSVDSRSAFRTISISSETDLMSGHSTGSGRWDCTRALRIVKLADQAQCPAPTTALFPAEYEAFYRILSPDQWRVNLDSDFNCAVPLNPSVTEQCYGQKAVHYNINQPCDIFGASQGMCPHWLTLCLRFQ
jgi:hypothetical protein